MLVKGAKGVKTLAVMIIWTNFAQNIIVTAAELSKFNVFHFSVYEDVLLRTRSHDRGIQTKLTQLCQQDETFRTPYLLLDQQKCDVPMIFLIFAQCPRSPAGLDKSPNFVWYKVIPIKKQNPVTYYRISSTENRWNKGNSA